MAAPKTSCVHRGNTFYGDVIVRGMGPGAEVRVRYNGAETAARVGSQPADLLAQALLRELVVLEAIGTVVTEAAQSGLAPLAGSDALERRSPRAA